MIAALQDKIKALPPTSVVGLWTFDGHEGRSEVAAGPLCDPVNGQPRSAALTAALDKQYSSAGGAVSFTTLRMIYQDMQANYRRGPDQLDIGDHGGARTRTKPWTGPGLQDFIRSSADPAKPIAVNVIDFGGDPDRATWEAVAQLSGGSYQNLATSASPTSPRQSTHTWAETAKRFERCAGVHGEPTSSTRRRSVRRPHPWPTEVLPSRRHNTRCCHSSRPTS